MANEATLIFETAIPIPFTCANTAGIEKGAILALSDPSTVATSTALADVIAGISATEKIASDGKTTVAVYDQGIFKMTLSGACIVGEALVSAKANKVSRNHSVLSGARILGTALETGADGETIRVKLNIQNNITV